MNAVSRRKLLRESTRFGAACALAPMGAAADEVPATQEADEASQPRKLKIIVTGGHPGDPEYGCGGTIAR